MSEKTGIAWCDHTFNPWWGCAKVSPGCERCYAESWDARFGGEHWGPKAERRQFGDKHWNDPIRWNRDAEKAGERRRVFCASMADVFEDRRDLDAPRERLFRLIEGTPHLDWLLLSKRPENMPRLAPRTWAHAWPLNAWAGATVEDQRRLDERAPRLCAVPAAVRFLSVEPQLEHVDTRPWLYGPRAIHWVIIGGESGASPRPFSDSWALSLIGQCHDAGAAAFMKQRGGFPDKRAEPAFWPEMLRVREFPR